MVRRLPETGLTPFDKKAVRYYNIYIMKTMKKQLDWFDVAMWALLALGLAVNPLFWILAVIGIGMVSAIVYAAILYLGIAGAIVFIVLSSSVIFLSRKYGLC